ncbi:hypothetical protein GCM10027185_13000 [Spirosoma pulveris]
MSFAEKDWQRKFYARHAYLLIYESMDKIFTLTGTRLRAIIANYPHGEAYIQQLNSINKILNKFKSQHSSTLMKVRNNSVGHRDKNVLIQLESIESISWYDSTTMSIQFDSIIKELGPLCQQLMNQSVSELYRGAKIQQE